RSAPAHLEEAPLRCRRQRFGGRVARGAYGADDAAAGRGNLRVGCAAEASSQLVAPIAGEDGVGVGVDETGNDGAAAGIEGGGVRRQRALAPPVLFAADKDDASLVSGDGGSWSRARVVLCASDARRGAGAGQDFRGVVDE